MAISRSTIASASFVGGRGQVEEQRGGGLRVPSIEQLRGHQAVEEDFWVEATQTSARETRGAEGETRGAEEGAKRAKTK